MRPVLRGKVTDYGDLVKVTQWIVKGRKHFRLAWHIGAPADTTTADRIVRGVATNATGKVDLIMDLQADKKVALSVQWTDEVGNPTEVPADAVSTFTVDDPTLINLTDNGDGTAEAAATGTLGTANVHLEAEANGDTFTGDLQIVVVAGLAERVNVVAGEPEEITPDE